MSELKYYCFEDIIKFLGLDFKFQWKPREYPFNKDPKDISCSWGQILIPEKGIRDTIINKLSDNGSLERPSLTELNMVYQIPFMHEDRTGIINQDISLTFRYDKTYKYGDITKGIAEVCFYILEYGTKTNGFYIITDDCIQSFFSNCIIPNQWGIGSTFVSSPCCENMGFIETMEVKDEEKTND